uniref:Uncharacterized protein n=1 Tax=Panagrolaimus sp. ES5 TaxID=591445 RepID=A0AC34FP40_9BILA
MLSHFVGVQDEKALYKLLRPTKFLLYYKKSNATTLNDLPYSIPLTMAYMSNQGIVHHFPVQVDTRDDGSSFWYVNLGLENKNQQPYKIKPALKRNKRSKNYFKCTEKKTASNTFI